MLLIATGIFSCIRRDFDKVTLDPWEPSLAVPLMQATLSIKDAATKIDVENLNVIENADGMYVLIYRDTLQSVSAENIIRIPNQYHSHTYNFTLNENTKVNNGETVTKEHSESETFVSEDNEEITRVELKEGLLSWTSNSGFPHDLLIKFRVPKLTRDGIPYSGEVQMTGASPKNANLTENLAGYTLDLTGSDGDSFNTFDWEVEITATSNGSTSIDTQVLQLEVSLTNLKYSRLFGKLGSKNLTTFNGAVGIDIFDNPGDGNVVFNDPKIRLNVENSFGLPVEFRINRLSTINHNTGQSIALTSSGDLLIPGPNSIAYPSSPGQTAETNYLLDKNNSNIVDAFTYTPNELNYTISPSLASDQYTNFVEDQSRFKAYLEAEFPMDGILKWYSLQDTIYDIDLPDEDYIQSVLLKIKTVNSMPLDIQLQGYWLDSLGNMIDSLIIPDKRIARSGVVDHHGEVTQQSTEYTEILYDKDRYNKVKRARRLLLEGYLLTTDQGNRPVKFFSHNALNLQLSILVNAKVEFE